MGAGDLRDRVLFQARGNDENGDPLGEFENQFTVWAQLIYQRGSETAVSNRLEGRLPVAVLIRDSEQARSITEGWRGKVMFGPRKDHLFNITSVGPAQERGFLSLQGVFGGATG